jgi:HAMP domain-containing protein
MRTPKRIFAALLAVLAAFAYVWFASVRAVPGVRRRKEAARQDRRD